MRDRVFVGGMDGRALGDQLRAALEWLATSTRLTSNTRVFVKPNLTWPEPTPGVTTRPEFIEAVISVLRTYSNHVVIGESDGGYGSYDAEEAFKRHRVYEIADRYGVSVVNLTDCQSVAVEPTVNGNRVQLRLPRLLLEDVDCFVTLPVPKVHAMTGVSLGFKNQWGCLPDVMRLRNHAHFDAKIMALNELLRPALALYDGKYFLDVNGPIHGEPIQMDLFVASTDVGAGDAVCCAIMGIDPSSIGHLKLARNLGMFPPSLEAIEMNVRPEQLRTRRFRVQRNFVNWIALAAFQRGWLTTLLYDSSLADPLHSMLYALRRWPTLGRLLYGRLGPPPVEGRRK